MENIVPKNLKRNPEAIKSKLKEVGDVTIVTDRLRVIYPERFEKLNLAILGNTVRLIGIFAIVDDHGNYAVNNTPIFLEMEPTNISFMEIDNVMYKVLEFEESSNYLTNNNLVVNNKFLYDLFNEFYVNGKVPWYMGYNDIIKIFFKTKKYANATIGNNPIISEILASIIAKSPNDKSIQYRTIIKSLKDTEKVKPKYIGLSNPYYTYDNTVSKLAGSYFNDGIDSSIINKEKDTTNIEEILRA